MELADLVQRIRRGDRDALKTLIAEYGAGVYRKAYQKTQDKELAREATRRTFAQLVTTLQEQTELDGWELWLNALAKRNIETYGNLRKDMAFVQGELDRELFCAPAADKPRLAEQNQGAAAFWQEGPFVANGQAATVQRKQERIPDTDTVPGGNGAAPFDAEAARLRQAQFAASTRGAQAAAQRQATEREPRPTGAASATRQPSSVAAGRPMGKQSQKSGRLFDSAEQSKRKPPILAEILLVTVCLLLIWLVIGVMMSMGWLPELDLGYQWCNQFLQVDFF